MTPTPESPVTEPTETSEKKSELGTMEVSTTFIYYCVCTTAISAFLASKVLHLSLATPQPYRLGLVAGIVGGILGAYFNHTASFSIAVAEPQTLETKVGEILTAMGFEPEAVPQDTEEFAVYRRPFWSNLFSGAIIIQRQAGKMTFYSRSSNIKRLQQKLE